MINTDLDFINTSMRNKYIDLVKVKTIPITEILTRVGVEPVKRGANDWAYHAPWREDKNASMHVRLSSNTWKDFGEEGSGTSNIDLVIRLGIARDWKDAALWIMEMGDASSAMSDILTKVTPHRDSKMPKTTSIMEVKIIESERLYLYGESRGISRSVIKQYCRQVSFRSQGGSVYTAVGFENLMGGYVLRQDKWLKCNVGPSTFSFISESMSSDVCVFEGFFDFLSFKELYPGESCDFLVLNSVVHSSKAAQYLRDKNYSQVRCYLDADKKGYEALSVFKSIIGPTKVFNASIIYAGMGFKDFNEMLMKCNADNKVW